jgi:RNA polymerase sigma-70 factor (ECF subfamily)
MSGAPSTQPSLLVRICNAEDAAAWAQFVEIYAPLIYGHARKSGFQDADAADLTQEVLRTVARNVNKLDYDPCRGSFRGWLFTIVRNLQRNCLLQQKRHLKGRGATGMQALLDRQAAPEADDAARWEEEHKQRLFTWAAEKVREQVKPSTWQAFWQTSVEGKSYQEVARTLHMTVGAVYVAKSRILTRIRAQIRDLQGE